MYELELGETLENGLTYVTVRFENDEDLTTRWVWDENDGWEDVNSETSQLLFYGSDADEEKWGQLTHEIFHEMMRILDEKFPNGPHN